MFSKNEICTIIIWQYYIVPPTSAWKSFTCDLYFCIDNFLLAVARCCCFCRLPFAGLPLAICILFSQTPKALSIRITLYSRIMAKDNAIHNKSTPNGRGRAILLLSTVYNARVIEQKMCIRCLLRGLCFNGFIFTFR